MLEDTNSLDGAQVYFHLLVLKFKIHITLGQLDDVHHFETSCKANQVRSYIVYLHWSICIPPSGL